MAQLVGGCHFKKIKILKDQELGSGSYGMVCKALCDELQCAAKLLHPVLVSERNIQKFHQECQLLAALTHPNIIQYLGTHTLNERPTCQVLLMELMEESLTSLLERSASPLPFHTEVSLCRDISLALAYLHSNDIIHRDLSSNNVLLTGNMRAKVTDFGMSRLTDDRSTLTQAPGCAVYMSPEALAHTPKYSQKLDIFSFGVLMIQILTRKFPSPGSPRKKMVNQGQSLLIEVPVIETERRKAHIDLIDPTHPLLRHACACLSYENKDRPTAQEMCHDMSELVKCDHYLSAKCDSEGVLVRLQRQLKDKEEELTKKDEVISKKDEETVKMSGDLAKMDKEIFNKNEVISKKDGEIVKMGELIVEMSEEHTKMREEFAKTSGIISRKDQEIVKMSKELARMSELISRKDREIVTMSEELAKMSGIISGKDQDIVKMSKEIAKMSGLISKKDQEIGKMSEELTKISGFTSGKDRELVKRNEARRNDVISRKDHGKGAFDLLHEKHIGIKSLLDTSSFQTSCGVEYYLTCPQCHKLFEDPKVLPCLHIMCKACIQSFLTGGEGRVHCPGCKTPVAIPQNGVSKLPTAFFIANMIEATKTLKKAHEPNTVCANCGSGNEAAAYCTDCASFLCKDCCLNHRMVKVLKEHKVTEIKDVDKSKLATKVVGSLCPKHTSGKLELYCCTCKSLVCYECVYLEHPKPQHDVKLLKECIAPSKEAIYEAVASLVQEVKADAPGAAVASLLEEVKADVPGAVASLVHCDSKLQNVIEEVNVKKGALLEHHHSVVQSINESFNHLVQFLQEKVRILLSEVEKLFDSTKGDLDLQVRSMEILQAHIRTVQSFLKYLDGHSCDEDFVPIQHLVCARIGELREMCRELKQKLTSDAMLVPNASCTNVEQPAGVWHLTVAMGDCVMQDVKVKVTNVPSVDFAVQTDEGEGESTEASGVLRGAMSSTNGADGESAGSSLNAGDNITGGKSPHGMPLHNLSLDVLYLLEKLPDGDIEGVVYRPSEGTAFIQGPTAEAVDQCITKVQSAFQEVIYYGQFKAEDVQHSSSLDPNYVLYLVAKLNIRHNVQSVFVYMEEKGSVRVISNSPQQFDMAKKELSDCLERFIKSSKTKPPPLFAVKLCGNRVLTLKQSDLVSEDVEVIVNAANEKLDCGGGVALALNRASGGGLQKVSKAYTDAHGPVQMGGVAVTASGGGSLKCKHVYHAVGPKASDYSPNDCRRLIGQVVEQVLITAEWSGILSVALPAISSGIYGVDKDLVAEVIIDTILTHQFTSRPPVLGDIRIVINDGPIFECFAKYFNQRKKVMTTSLSIPTTPSSTSTPTSAGMVKRGSTGGHVPTSVGEAGDITYPNLNGSSSVFSDDKSSLTGEGQSRGASGNIGAVFSSIGASSDDLSNTIAAVGCISGQWKKLGSSLGIQPVILDAIQGPPEVCMVVMMKRWAHEAMAASWHRLSSALVKMGRADLAERVMKGVQLESAGSSLDASDNIARGPLLKSPHGMPVSNLSPDVLYLLEKLPDGDIEGVVYRPSEGTAFIQGPTPEAVDQCITKVQSAIQEVIFSGQLKVEDVQHSSSLDPNYVLYLVSKLNIRHNQCVFVYMEEKVSVKVISNSPRQFDIAKKELSDCLDRLKSSKTKPPPLLAVKLCGNRVLTLKQSDLVSEEVEVIVNAANEKLDCGGGVALALNRASGGGLQKVSKAYTDAHGPVQMGGVAVTASGGGSLKCKHVYHAVGPKASDYSPNDCRRLIGQVVEQVLITAEWSGILSVALPAISSGIYGVDKDLVAEVIIDTILTHQFTSRPPVLGDIRIVINDGPIFECFAKYFNQRKKVMTSSLSIPTTPSTPTSVVVVKRGSTGGHVPTSAGAVGDITYPNLNGSSSAFCDDKSSLKGEGQSRGASGNIGAVFSSSGASSNDLSNTIAAVACISGQWKELGSSLGLQPVILDAIQGPPEECMVLMMKRWAHEAMAASWHRLSSALMKMGRADLAERVMEGVQLESDGSSLDARDNIVMVKSPHGMSVSNLSPDVLYLLEKLPDGDIEGVVYRPSEGTAFIQGPTALAVDQCITKVQSAYQKVISLGQFKAEDVQHSSSLDPNHVLYLVAKLNTRHNQCVFVYMEEKSLVRVISNLPRQFAGIAKKEISDCLDRLKSSKAKPPPLFAVKLCGNRVLSMKQSDLVSEEVEVIVNAANEDLSHRAGVAGALDKASGGGLQKVSTAYTDAHGPVQMGGVAVTASGGGALKCKHVYHAVGPKASDYSPNDCRRLIGRVVEQVLIIAERSDILSVALPAICSGIFGVDKDLVAEVIIDTILTYQFTSRPPVLGDIRIVINDSPTFECFAKYLNQRKKVMTISPSIPTTPSTTSTPTSADVVKRGSTGGHVPTSAGAVGVDGQTGYDTPVDPTSRRKLPKTGKFDNCPICLGPPQNPVTSRCCQKVYCKACLEESLKSFPNCPTCRTVLRGGAKGNQPPGTMDVQRHSSSLPGYEGYGSIVISYNHPDGRQGPQHPSPGQHYYGTQRTAYLPDNQEGREVLELLRKAWDAKVIFTIGTSVTSGYPNTVIWNGIHHKTSTSGGSYNYGYPDPTYLSRVKQELAAKGIR